MAIFIDAGVFCAYANSHDVHHLAAQEILREIFLGENEKAITTDYVFDEVVTVALRKTNKATALELGEFIMNSEIFLAGVDATIFRKAWEIFCSKHLIQLPADWELEDSYASDDQCIHSVLSSHLRSAGYSRYLPMSSP